MTSMVDSTCPDNLDVLDCSKLLRDPYLRSLNESKAVMHPSGEYRLPSFVQSVRMQEMQDAEADHLSDTLDESCVPLTTLCTDITKDCPLPPPPVTTFC